MLIPERLHAAHVAQRAPYQENPSPREMGAGRDLFARRKDGSEFAVDVSLSPLATPEGMLVISTVRDVTERTQAEAALRASEGQLRRAQNLAQMGTDLRDLRTGDREWSDETYRILGVSRDSFDPTQENVLALIHPDDRHLIFAARAQTAAGITPGPMEYRIIRPDGSLRHVYREWELIRDDTGEPVQFLGTIQDITERRRTEEQLRQAQKMEAIGNLTGGMAHDFNNLLGIIVGNLGLAQERVGSDGELQELVGESLEAAWRGADLTRRLLAFARRQPLRPTRIDINDLVSNASRLLQRLLGEDIEIVLDLGELIWPVAADPAQLESSVANLATNARDAMPKGGRLIITTANSHLDADYAASYDDVTPGDFAMIAVSDTGTGMPPEIINKIFEPFFTTKGPGKGTGLGLAMVFGFIKQSGGHVTVYSEPGIGTTFRLYLPRAEAEGMLDEVSSARPIARAAGESVLVVEDNAGVRRVVVRQLGELGYRVLESDHATAALDVLAREAVDLMFSDIIMPGGIWSAGPPSRSC
jgi:PAS domain S-box-containing protein